MQALVSCTLNCTEEIKKLNCMVHLFLETRAIGLLGSYVTYCFRTGGTTEEPTPEPVIEEMDGFQ